MSKILHKNDNYEVTLTVDGLEYALKNVNTGVLELTSSSLPEIIGHAEQSNAYLKHEAWQWLDAQVKQQLEWAGAQFGMIVEFEPDLDPPESDSGDNLLN